MEKLIEYYLYKTNTSFGALFEYSCTFFSPTLLRVFFVICTFLCVKFMFHIRKIYLC